MNHNGTIHRQIIATGREWKACIECGQSFEAGEVLTAIDTHSNNGVIAWFCESCTEHLFGHLLAVCWQETWQLHHRDGQSESIDRKMQNAPRYDNAG